MALCHVISWFDIRCRLDILMEEAFKKESESAESNDENYNDIRNFLSKLYTPDTEAVVNFGAWYPPLTFDSWDKPDKPWFEQTPYARPFVGGTKIENYSLTLSNFNVKKISIFNTISSKFEMFYRLHDR